MTHVPQRPLTRREEAMLIASLWAFSNRRELVAADLQASRERLVECRKQFAALRGPR